MSTRLRLVFAGTPDFAVPSLHACVAADVDVVAVYSQPDRPAGRGRKLTPSPVKQAALAAGIEVRQPESFRSLDARRELAAFMPDLMVVVAYGLILSRSVLAIPRLGCWNVHASLLPRWRGAAPIQRAILAGDVETGVGLMQMEAGLDTGPVLLERRVQIGPKDTGGTLHDTLSALGAEVLADGLSRLIAEHMPTPVAQSDHAVEYARKLDKAEARLDWNTTAIELERKVRAFDPWPVAEAELAGERLRIWAAHAIDDSTSKIPGTVIAVSADGVDIACRNGALRILEIQRDGGRRMPVRDWLNARSALAHSLTGKPA